MTQQEIDVEMVKQDEIDSMWNEHDNEYKLKKPQFVSMTRFISTTRQSVVAHNNINEPF